MNDLAVMTLAQKALMMALLLAAPLLATALVVGIIVSVFQAVTQVQEQTLSFVPKLLAVCLVALAVLPWLIQTAVQYATEIFRSLPSLAA